MAKSHHTKEFKNKAVKLALEKDANRKQIADNLGINYKVVWFSSIFIFIMLNQKWLKLTYIVGIAIHQRQLKQERTN